MTLIPWQNGKALAWDVTVAEFLADLGQTISGDSVETTEGLFLFQRLSIVLQRYSAILLHEIFYEGDEPSKYSLQLLFINLLCLISPPLGIEYQGQFAILKKLIIINNNNNNNTVFRSLRRAQVQASKEPLGLLRSDGKRPDGVTLFHGLVEDV